MTLVGVVEGITVVKFGMNNGGGNGRGCFEIEVRPTHAQKFKVDSQSH